MRHIVTKRIVFGILITAMLAMVSCTGVEEGERARAPGMALASEKPRVAPADIPDSDLSRLVEGNSAFAFDLYRFLAEREGGENLFYSPYSISLALAMTYAGARGQTEAQMTEALRFRLAQEDLHAAFNALDQELAQRGEDAEGKDEEGFRLNIANAIWGQEDYEFLSSFLDVLAENYGAGLRILDFAEAPEASRVAINEWISEQTEGRIEDLVPEGAIDPLTRLVLTNAIYFNAAWANPFQERATRERPFTRLDGSEVPVPMMHQTTPFLYAAGEDFQAVQLHYDGYDMSMVVVVPRQGDFEAFEESLDGGRMQAIIEELERREVALAMPKFEFDASFGLKEALSALGMPQAFTGDADFSGMTGSQDLFISEVLHEAFVSVDEEGTEAAAATAVIMPTSAMPEEPVELTIDHPFIFLIRDIQTGAVLFVGRVLDPSA